jgi:hypothetical protein
MYLANSELVFSNKNQKITLYIIYVVTQLEIISALIALAFFVDALTSGKNNICTKNTKASINIYG